MDDRIRASDADREHVTARLREHFAAGRLTADELDERISAALNAKTYGELRRLMADLPEPAPAPPRAAAHPYPAAPPVTARRGPRLLPALLLAGLAALLFPGGHWVFLGFFQVLLVLWLLACLGGAFAASRHHRHRRRSA
ncbi:MAG: DUF1707 domain-containing protein [Actinobacteria bacterium]|nr:DUF1707 domain-containing protein [Actinomycetota bacterium]